MWLKKELLRKCIRSREAWVVSDTEGETKRQDNNIHFVHSFIQYLLLKVNEHPKQENKPRWR